MLNRSTLRWLPSLLAVVLLTAGCGQGGSQSPAGGAAVYPVTAVQLTAGSGSSASGRSAAAALGGFADVVQVSIEVDGPNAYGVTQNPLATTSLTQGSDGVWRGTLANLTVGPSLTFTGRAYDAAGTLLYSGVSTQSVSANDRIGLALQAAGGLQLSFPSIVRISLPGEITAGSQVTVSADVQASAGETLSYRFQPADASSGSFSPAQDSLTLPAGTSDGTLSTRYTAPDAAGSYTASLTVSNSQGNAVQSDFPLTVVNGTGDGGATVGFAPVIQAISGHRDGNTVTWTATVSDDGPLSALSYAWSFIPGTGSPVAVFTDATDNPGVLSGYDASVVGTITLQVTDGDGLSTSITFALPAGQFPDAVVLHPPVAVDDAAQTTNPDPITLDVLANDSDPDGDTLTISAVSAPQHGTVTHNSDGTLTYTPDAGFDGTDAFTYTVSDGHGGYDTATVTVTVAVDATLGDRVSIGAGTTLGSGVVIDHDVRIGTNCSLGAATQVGHNTHIGDRCTLGAGVSIDHNVHIGDHAQIGDGSQIAHNSHLGDDVTIGSRVTLDSTVYIADGAQVGDGSSIGHSTFIGTGAVLGADVVLGRNVHIGAHATVADGASLPDNTVVPDGASVP